MHNGACRTIASRRPPGRPAIQVNKALCVQLIVLGMHRSGTSVLARILNLMGIYLGPEGMSTGANPENPKGFWERRDIRQLNDAVLHSVGCDWDRVSTLDLGTVPAEMQAAFDHVARRILLEMDAHRPWFIKEPRLCLLLPMWRRHMEVPLVVNIHRDPVEVAASLHRRNGIPIEAGLELWEYYTRSAAAAAFGLPSVSVLHTDLMAHPDVLAGKLYDDLVRLGVQGIRPVAEKELLAFIDRRLHRERAPRSGVDVRSDSRQARIYRGLAKGDTSILTAVPAADWRALRKYESTLDPVPHPDPRKVRAAGYDAFMLDERLKSSVRRMARIESALKAHLDVRADHLENQLRALREGAHLELGQRNRSGTLEEAIAARERVERELEQRYAELALAARELDAARRAVARCPEVEEQLDVLRAQIRDLEAQLKRGRGERRAVAAQLESERNRNARLQWELDAITGSRSWRLTAPLRAVVQSIRSRRRRS